VEHRQYRYLNNRAKNPHHPTRQWERRVQGFSRQGTLNAFSPRMVSLRYTSARDATGSPPHVLPGDGPTISELAGDYGDYRYTYSCLRAEPSVALLLLCLMMASARIRCQPRFLLRLMGGVFMRRVWHVGERGKWEDQFDNAPPMSLSNLKNVQSRA